MILVATNLASMALLQEKNRFLLEKVYCQGKENHTENKNAKL